MTGKDYKIDSCALELTLACNARCVHCGSDARNERVEELTTEEALKLVADVAELGCTRFTFSGGEPFTRRDWPILAEAVNAAGMRLEVITNGLLVAKLWLEGSDINRELVAAAQAWGYRKYVTDETLLKVQQVVNDAELDARLAATRSNEFALRKRG